MTETERREWLEGLTYKQLVSLFVMRAGCYGEAMSLKSHQLIARLVKIEGVETPLEA